MLLTGFIGGLVVGGLLVGIVANRRPTWFSSAVSAVNAVDAKANEAIAKKL
jgi:protease II